MKFILIQLVNDFLLLCLCFFGGWGISVVSVPLVSLVPLLVLYIQHGPCCTDISRVISDTYLLTPRCIAEESPGLPPSSWTGLSPSSWIGVLLEAIVCLPLQRTLYTIFRNFIKGIVPGTYPPIRLRYHYIVCDMCYEYKSNWFEYWNLNSNFKR